LKDYIYEGTKRPYYTSFAADIINVKCQQGLGNVGNHSRLGN
jgi:hypothetical protein